MRTPQRHPTKQEGKKKKQNRTNNIADWAANRILMATFIFHPGEQYATCTPKAQ